MALKHVSKKNLAKRTLGPGLALPWGPDTLTYLLAGRCVSTLSSKSSALRHTYYISQASDDVEQDDGSIKEVPKQLWFVNLLVGSDNARSYKYIGVIDDRHGVRRFRTTKNTKQVAADAINLVGDTIAWLADGASAGHKVAVWQMGICGKCTADLTVPSSIATGLGPVCASHLGVEMKKVEPTAIEKLASLAPVETPSPVPSPVPSPIITDPPYPVATPKHELAIPEPQKDQTETVIEALIAIAGLDPSTKDALMALVAVLPKKAKKSKKLSDLRKPKKTTEEAA